MNAKLTTTHPRRFAASPSGAGATQRGPSRPSARAFPSPMRKLCASTSSTSWRIVRAPCSRRSMDATVRTSAGVRRLATRNARIVDIPMDVAEQFLSLLSDPNVGSC